MQTRTWDPCSVYRAAIGERCRSKHGRGDGGCRDIWLAQNEGEGCWCRADRVLRTGHTSRSEIRGLFGSLRVVGDPVLPRCGTG
jgi:hypothetical protein